MQGLENLGNTCYLNSVIQLLRYSRPLVEKMQDKTSNNKFTNRLIDLLYLYPDKESLRYVVKHLHEIGFQRFFQSDAHECLLSILDRLYEEMKVDTFRGSFSTKLECCFCRNVSTTNVPFHTVSLSIDKEDSIESCMKRFLDTEIVFYNCEKCSRRDHKKYTTIHPNDVLFIHLKRFNGEKKLKYDIHISNNILHKYKLAGVVCHTGTLQYGHYTAVCKKLSGQWLVANDESVRDIDGIPVKSHLPYILVYIKS